MELLNNQIDIDQNRASSVSIKEKISSESSRSSNVTLRHLSQMLQSAFIQINRSICYESYPKYEIKDGTSSVSPFSHQRIGIKHEAQCDQITEAVLRILPELLQMRTDNAPFHVRKKHH